MELLSLFHLLLFIANLFSWCFYQHLTLTISIIEHVPFFPLLSACDPIIFATALTTPAPQISLPPHLILRSFGVLRLAKAKMREDKHQHVATQASVLSTCVRGIRSELSFLLDPALVLARSHAINKEVSGTRSLWFNFQGGRRCKGLSYEYYNCESNVKVCLEMARNAGSSARYRIFPSANTFSLKTPQARDWTIRRRLSIDRAVYYVWGRLGCEQSS